ncbi:MAG: hypothetical protein AABX66_01250 [Nanoarchaeota archaeon]
MGKNSVIKTLGKRIGNVVLHKLLIKYTHRPESINHLQKEEVTYRDAAIKDAREYNWNEGDKQTMKIQAIRFIKDKKVNKYSDVDLPSDEIEKLVEEEIVALRL